MPPCEDPDDTGEDAERGPEFQSCGADAPSGRIAGSDDRDWFRLNDCSVQSSLSVAVDTRETLEVCVFTSCNADVMCEEGEEVVDRTGLRGCCGHRQVNYTNPAGCEPDISPAYIRVTAARPSELHCIDYFLSVDQL